MWKLSGLCLLLAALGRAVAGDKVTTAYFTDGGELTLNVTPPYAEKITNILWKFNGNLLAEWVLDKVDLELYGSFKGRADLDTLNARLVIKRMSKEDVGAYTVGINTKVHGESYDAKWLKKLGQPEVVIQPLICGLESKRCNVNCVEDTKEAGPVTYSWKIGEKEWKVLEKDIEINTTDNVLDKTITCRISNPVSEQVSKSIENPLYYNIVPTVVGVVVFLLAVAVAVGVGVFFMCKLKKLKNPFRDRNSTKPDPTANTPDPTHNKPDPAPNKPDPTPDPNTPDPAPNKPDPAPNKPDPTPTPNTPDPTPTPNTPDPTPTPNTPDPTPTPNTPDPTPTPLPEEDPSDTEKEERMPLVHLQDGSETV